MFFPKQSIFRGVVLKLIIDDNLFNMLFPVLMLHIQLMTHCYPSCRCCLLDRLAWKSIRKLTIENTLKRGGFQLQMVD